MNEREEYLLKRKRKKIRLKQIADHIGCSVALLSRWETGGYGIAEEKKRKYKDFIEKYNF